MIIGTPYRVIAPSFWTLNNLFWLPSSTCRWLPLILTCDNRWERSDTLDEFNWSLRSEISFWFCWTSSFRAVFSFNKSSFNFFSRWHGTFSQSRLRRFDLRFGSDTDWPRTWLLDFLLTGWRSSVKNSSLMDSSLCFKKAKKRFTRCIFIEIKYNKNYITRKEFTCDTSQVHIFQILMITLWMNPFTYLNSSILNHCLLLTKSQNFFCETGCWLRWVLFAERISSAVEIRDFIPQERNQKLNRYYHKPITI